MKRLTEKEEEIMKCFWDKGPMYVRDIIDLLPDPKPHFNTVSTFVRLLEQKGFVGHERTGNSYRYFPVVNREDYSASALNNIIERYFDSSVMNVVSALVRDKNLSDDEVGELINLVKSNQKPT